MMKKLSTLIAAMAILVSSFASSVPHNTTPRPMRASEVMIPVGKEGKKVSLLDLSKMSKKELETITGRKMNFMQSLAFKGAREKLRNSINDDGVVTDKKVEKMFSSDSGDTGFHLGGFALGFLLGLLGVLIAYLINDDKKHNRRKWAWIGLAASLVLSIILIAAVF